MVHTVPLWAAREPPKFIAAHDPDGHPFFDEQESRDEHGNPIEPPAIDNYDVETEESQSSGVRMDAIEKRDLWENWELLKLFDEELEKLSERRILGHKMAYKLKQIDGGIQSIDYIAAFRSEGESMLEKAMSEEDLRPWKERMIG